MRSKFSSVLAVMVVFVGLTSGKVQASSEPAVRFTQFPSAWQKPPTDKNTTDGWRFTVEEIDIIVTHLGLYDRWPGGFGSSHQIAIWGEDSSSALVTATIPAGTGTPDSFVYVEVDPVILSKDETYIIGAFFPAGQSDWEVTNHISKEFNVNVGYLGAARAYGDFRQPDTFYPSTVDSFGPNFLLTPTPEPTTLLLLGLGAVMLRRKR